MTTAGRRVVASRRNPTRLVVSAAASMTEALEKCGPQFGEAENAEVRMSFAGSDELAAQIRQGAKVDAYAAANTRLPEELYAEDLLSKPVEFATNEFVLAVPKDSDIDSIDDLTKEGTAVVIGSESVPIGEYTRETLAKLPPAQEKAILANVRSERAGRQGHRRQADPGRGRRGLRLRDGRERHRRGAEGDRAAPGARAAGDLRRRCPDRG